MRSILKQKGRYCRYSITPGDPLRAKYIAETFLKILFDIICETHLAIQEPIRENEYPFKERAWEFHQFPSTRMN